MELYIIVLNPQNPLFKKNNKCTYYVDKSIQAPYGVYVYEPSKLYKYLITFDQYWINIILSLLDATFNIIIQL